MLENGLIPPTINHHKRNPNIKFDEWNLSVPTKLTPWPIEGLRRMSVNSFGCRYYDIAWQMKFG